MTLSRRFLLGAAAAGLAPGTTLAQGRGTQNASAVLRRTRDTLGIPALAAAAARPDRLEWNDAAGMADLELQRPADNKSRFRLGSCSKVVTATIALRLAERGVVDLDRPIAGYRPDLPDAHRTTTLRQLFAHVGGVRHYAPRDFAPSAGALPIDLRAYPSPVQALAVFIGDPLVAPVGETYLYSTFAFTLISAILETAAGVSFPELIRREVSEPLGLTFAAETANTILADRVRPYGRRGQSGPVENAEPVNPDYKWAGGGMIGTASDLARLGAALLRPGYLTRASLDQMVRPLAPRRARANDPVVGLAWRIDTDPKGRRRFHHAGSIQGGRSGVVIYPDAGLALAMTSNLSDTPLTPLGPLGELADVFGV